MHSRLKSLQCQWTHCEGREGGGGGEGENLLLPRLQFALAPNLLCALQPT